MSKWSNPGLGSGLGSGTKMWIPLDPDSQHCCMFKLQCYDFFSFWYIRVFEQNIPVNCYELSLVMILPHKTIGHLNLIPAGRQDVYVCCGAEGEVWFGQARRRHFCTPRKEDLFCHFARTPTSTLYWTHCYQNMEWKAIQKRYCILWGPNFEFQRTEKGYKKEKLCLL